MTKPQDTVTIKCTLQDMILFRPTFRVNKQTLVQTLCHPSTMSNERKINIDKRTCRRETLPSGRNAAKTINDPFVMC